MRLPSTIQYIETITNPYGLFKTLKQVEPFVDNDSHPIYFSGNFGTVFKVKTSEGIKALKCFTRYQPGRLSAYSRIAEEIPQSKYIIRHQYLPEEIYVFGEESEQKYYPLLVMDWVEGMTMSKAIHRAVINEDVNLLKTIQNKFIELSDWLLTQHFAHGDLKPDNIIIRSEDEQMILVDYDGIFVKSMEGEEAREYGTAPYQSPDRVQKPFDKRIDDYSIAYIRLAMEVLCKDVSRYSESNMVDFTPSETAEITEVSRVLLQNNPFVENSKVGISLFKKGGKYGYVNASDELLCETMYTEATDFTEEGVAAVSRNGKWGYINTKGEEVIPPQYDESTPFSEGIAAV